MSQEPNKSSRSRFWRGAAVGALALVAIAATAHFTGVGPAVAQMTGHGNGMHRAMHSGSHGGGMHGMHGANYDDPDFIMPGLRGADATEEESRELVTMFRNFESIDRTVENLPNGIRTVTYSSDPDVMDVLASHVTGMIARVEEGRDPQVFAQSPTLDILFERTGAITTEIDLTDEGIVVIQTSEDKEVVAALQTHAAEVTDLANRGMIALHESMMRR